MLHLKFALNLEHLADKMIAEISENWTDPFNAPIVIFPDFKLEQWFRLRWIKKNGVLANLNRLTIDGFMFKILAGERATKIGKLQSEMLANVIAAYLIKRETEGGPRNYETIDENGQVKRYLEKDGDYDAGKLYDFASAMAGLFLDYETSRPGKFLLDDQGLVAKGILDCWKDGELKDFFVKRKGPKTYVPVENEKWERELYSKIFHNNGGKSLLTQVFEKADPDPKDKCRYLTLPYLYRECLDEKGVSHFKYNPNKPIYVLGLSGMGQFYRIVLREYAKENEVFAYIQNPCMEFWEDVDTSRRQSLTPRVVTTEDGSRIEAVEEDIEQDNLLLRNWGRAGRDNIKLWCLSDDYSSCDFEGDYLSLLDREKKTDSSPNNLLHTIQALVAGRKSKLDTPLNPEQYKDDASLTITAAPSKLREVEALHTSICKLIDSKKAKFSDILVVSPNLQDYCPAIYQVFDQARIASQEGRSVDGKPIVHVPYNIIDSVEKESAVGEVLKILFQIRSTKNFSRQDFFNLVRNPVVQAVREIDGNTVSVWEKWLVDMNIYRNQDKNYDWNSGIDRMLLSRMTTSCVEVDGKECLPYADISSANDSLLLKFIATIEALKRWIDDLNEVGLEEKSMQVLQNMLNDWLLMRRIPDELAGESAIYKNTIKSLYDLRYFYYVGINAIPWDIVCSNLLNVAVASDFSYGSLFANGISFMKFAPNRTIPVKHLFFLGADADHFPGAPSSSSFDLRKDLRAWPGDDSITDRNRYAFLCQLMSTSEGFHISYQNKNLVKDSDIYPSPVVNDLINFVESFAGAGVLKETLIPLDENRLNMDLYTRRSWRYRESAQKLRLKPSKVEKASTTGEKQAAYEKIVSTYTFRKFLEDPFQLYVSRTMNLEELGVDPMDMTIEPVTLNNLESSVILKNYVFIQLGLNNDYKDVESYVNTLKIRGQLPHGALFGAQSIAGFNEVSSELAASIKVKYPVDAYNYMTKKIDATIKGEMGQDDKENVEFSLQGNVPFVVVSKQEPQKGCIIDLRGSLKASHFVKLYIDALGLIASGELTSAMIEVFSRDGKSDSCCIEMSKDDATKILIELYRLVFVARERRIIPFNLLSTPLKSLADLDRLLKKKNGEWSYFAGKELFDVMQDGVSGYPKDQDEFSTMWNSACEQQKSLVPESLLAKIKEVK
jgi:exodeoxyribonuclease V gamma subunit